MIPHRGPTLLVTGFEPWGGRPRNVSSEVATLLEGARLPGDTRARSLVLPVTLGEATRLLEDTIRRVQPVAVVAMGIHGKAGGPIRLEELAFNEQTYREPDSAGKVLTNAPIEQGGPASLGSTLPLDEVEAAIRARGVPVERSRDAGRFLCNATFYWLGRKVAAGALEASGFVHVPPREPGEPLDDILGAAEATLEVVARALAPSA